jgi:hypothetical protein
LRLRVVDRAKPVGQFSVGTPVSLNNNRRVAQASEELIDELVEELVEELGYGRIIQVLGKR